MRDLTVTGDFLVAVALVRCQDQVLLVEQDNDDGTSSWTLPAGVVEPGELLTEALYREVAEETGLAVEALGGVAYVAQLELPGHRQRWTATAVRVGRWRGELAPADPDGLVRDAAFVAVDEAVTRLSRLRSPVMRDPAVGWLTDQVPVGAILCYRGESHDHIGVPGKVRRRLDAGRTDRDAESI